MNVNIRQGIYACIFLSAILGCQPVHVSSHALMGPDPEIRSFVKDDEVWVELKAYLPENVPRWEIVFDEHAPQSLTSWVDLNSTYFLWSVGKQNAKLDMGGHRAILRSGKVERRIFIIIEGRLGNSVRNTLKVLVTLIH